MDSANELISKNLAVMTNGDVVIFAATILIAFLLLFALFCFGEWIKRRPATISLYSNFPLRRASDISYDSKVLILKFLYNMHQYDNRIFEFKHAAVCRDTGRIFQDSITWYDVIDVDWNFLYKRCPGNYVSWGSLNHEQQIAIRGAHDTLHGFQVEISSPYSSIRKLEPQYILAKPGPLYVDMQTKILMGWKCVPYTSFEVLIVQRPKKGHEFTVTNF